MNYAVILAGGTGSRTGSALPKQFHKVNGKPMLYWSIKAFHDFDPGIRIIVALPRDYFDLWISLYQELKTEEQIPMAMIEGGSSRFDSGYRAVVRQVSEVEKPAAGSKIFIHDGARPLLTPELCSRGEKIARPGVGAIPAVPVTDSLRKKEGEETVSVSREQYLAVQTPQIFIAEDIIRAYKEADSNKIFTDDASVAEASGIRIESFEGDPSNIKVTYPADFLYAESLFSANKRR